MERSRTKDCEIRALYPNGAALYVGRHLHGEILRILETTLVHMLAKLTVFFSDVVQARKELYPFMFFKMPAHRVER